jgi:hypothetical protein
MDVAAWRELLGTLTVQGHLAPVTEQQLDVYDVEAGVRLPASYRGFCGVFGPGVLGDWYEFAAPGYTGKNAWQFDLATMNADRRASLEWEEYAQDVEQFRRAIVFGGDQTAAMFLWDSAEITRPDENELAIYAIWRNWETERVCDTFWDFVMMCLHKGSRTLYDQPATPTFRGFPPYRRKK